MPRVSIARLPPATWATSPVALGDHWAGTPTAERFESDEEANGLLSRPQRKGYEVSA